MKLKSNWDSDPYFSSPVFLAYLLKKDIGYIIGAEGKTIDAQELIDRKLANYEEVVYSTKPYKDFALFAAALEALKGDNSQAMEYLELAKELQFQDYIMIDSNVFFDNLKSSSYFILYLERIKGKLRVLVLNSWANNKH